jgi:hypothetical protein
MNITNSKIIALLLAFACLVQAGETVSSSNGEIISNSVADASVQNDSLVKVIICLFSDKVFKICSFQQLVDIHLSSLIKSFLLNQFICSIYLLHFSPFINLYRRENYGVKRRAGRRARRATRRRATNTTPPKSTTWKLKSKILVTNTTILMDGSMLIMMIKNSLSTITSRKVLRNVTSVSSPFMMVKSARKLAILTMIRTTILGKLVKGPFSSLTKKDVLLAFSSLVMVTISGGTGANLLSSLTRTTRKLVVVN